MNCIECGKEIATGVVAQEWHHERGCCSPECLLAWERYRIGEVCGQYPFMLNLPHPNPPFLPPSRDYGRVWHESVASNILDRVIYLC